jgi:hypothetical protein
MGKRKFPDSAYLVTLTRKNGERFTRVVLASGPYAAMSKAERENRGCKASLGG